VTPHTLDREVLPPSIAPPVGHENLHEEPATGIESAGDVAKLAIMLLP